MTAAILDPKWIRSFPFDMTLIVGCVLLALACGCASYFRPDLYSVILFFNIWLLGYHHVIATYTRFLESSAHQNYGWMIIWLPIVVSAAVVAIGFTIGIWALATIYLYWQFYHYTRQAHGIAQAYRRKAGDNSVTLPMNLHNLLVYGVPLWGILYRSMQQPETFLNLPIRVIPYAFAYPASQIMMITCYIGIVAYIGYTVYQLFSKQPIALGYHLFTISHVVIFYIGYIYIDDINRGWLVLNIWHNMQYITFVWLFNKNRGEKFLQKQHDKASLGDNMYEWLCKQSSIIYFVTTFAATICFYFIANKIVYGINFMTQIDQTLVFMLVYQTINFHHYIVDGIIWKLRNKNIQVNLKL